MSEFIGKNNILNLKHGQMFKIRFFNSFCEKILFYLSTYLFLL